MASEIAVVGMACRYPDARSIQELWENVLAQRQAFRRFPPQRLRIEDYFSQDKSAPDTTYASQGAFIENYEFDRVRFRISGSTYRSSDLTHWLALDIASQALMDAGFASPHNLPCSTTGVIVGNTLTGEFSRANGLRLRWPYVRRVVEAALQAEGWTAEQCQVFLEKLETTYKEPFAPVGEETLAGGLSNTIAGRICNYFDLKGGGYTVDGACSSSLLAIATACSALASGDIDLALAGGVDLSLDPFELVGFAKTMALAAETMHVYDVHSNGFIPGEGCGFVVLMRYEDAVAQQRRIYALVRGWGISSDGSGGITRPEVEGQLLSLTRAYRKAEMEITSVAYFEGHGTGTGVGDATELRTLSHARLRADPYADPATIGSIKANIGHTKAAAGVAGFIKATMALFTQIIPPTTGTTKPHPEISNERAALKVQETGTLWPAKLPLRAGVSAMGFGGINTHLVLEGVSNRKRSKLTEREQCLLFSGQDAEIFLLAGQDTASVQQQAAHLLTFARQLSQAEIIDLAVYLIQTLQRETVRAAVVASNPGELTRRLERLNTLLMSGVTRSIDVNGGVYIGQGDACPRIGFLFPGQSSPVYLQGGLLRRRFAFVDDLYTRANLPITGDGKDTKVAQPAIVTASLAALRTLHALGITASIGIGHSLGELTALHWAGAFDEETALHLATFRGEAMSTLGDPTGAMVSIMAPWEIVEEAITGTDAVIAGLNAPNQTVVSGKATDITTVVARVQAQRRHATYLKVSHAFHSPLVAAAVEPFAGYLMQKVFQPLQRTVVSTVTGLPIEPGEDLKALLCEQITSPVQFAAAVSYASAEMDLLIEVGPGKILSGLASQCVQTPAIALDAGGSSARGLLHAAGAAFALGIPLTQDLLRANRFSRPFDLNWQPHFFANPCEQAPFSNTEITFAQREKAEPILENDTHPSVNAALPQQTDTSSITELVRQLVAERVELPVEAVGDSSRMLSDLHLNSITVGQIVVLAARSLGILPPMAPTEYADATVAEIAQALEELHQAGNMVEIEEHMQVPIGVDSWIRAFQVTYIETPLSPHSSGLSGQAAWNVLAPPDYPFGEALKQACVTLAGDGVLVCLPPHLDEQYLPLLLQGTHEALRRGSNCHFVLVQHGSGGAGIARTLFAEAPKQTVCVIDIPPEHPQAVNWVLAEIQAAKGYTEAFYNVHGKRSIPTLQLLTSMVETTVPLALGPHDVLLVTGGGKGIASECALSLACETGVRLALLGRSQPSNDQALAENLSRFTTAGVDFRYVSADVTDAEAVREAVREIEMNLGSVTAILHGAGTNMPKLLSTLKNEDVLHTMSPKVHGLKHVLSAVDPEKICLLVTFGSVIARTGMHGEADYALANDWLGQLTEEFQAQHPTCRCLCLEWSVWSSIGMGERLGSIETLMREGIMPISLDKGLAYFQHLLQHCLPSVRLVVANRFGISPVLQLVTPELPLLRFLEQPRIYYPAIELVVDAELSSAADLYLEDHRFRGERLLPAVVGLEAMAQVAMTVTEQDRRPHFENVRLDRPVIVPEKAALKVRIAALVQESGKVDIVLRSEETAFQVDHFRATCHFNDRPLEKLAFLSSLPEVPVQQGTMINLNPACDLYGSILFHQGRFQRIHSYYHLRASECVVEITSGKEKLFAQYLPSQLMLGDFTARDAVIHCIQACIPHARLLPVAIEEVSFTPGQLHSEQTRFVYAKERFRYGNDFTYDVEVRTAEGDVEEQWRGLQLRQVEALPTGESWKEALLGPYIERKLSEFFPAASIHLVIQSHANSKRHDKSNEAFHTLLDPAITIQRRPNGKPIVMDKHAPALSASHHEQFTLAMVSPQLVACDLESVAERPVSLWQDLLGLERYRLAVFIASQASEELHISATRIWGASECLRKAEAMANVPLTFEAMKEDGWILLRSGLLVIATYITTLHEREGKLAITICSEVERSREVEQFIKR